MESLSMKPPYARVSSSCEPVPVKRADMCTREIQVPMVKSNADTSNFSAPEEEMPPGTPYKAYEDPEIGWDNDFATSE